jgi:hypothetical protein
MAATGPARKFALDLAADRDLPDRVPALIAETLTRLGAGQPVTSQACSLTIDWLKPIPSRAKLARDKARAEGNQVAAAAMKVIKPGCFLLNGRVWIVCERLDHRGFYAKLLTETSRDPDHPEIMRFDVTYDRAQSLAVLADLTEELRMTFETARKLMIRYGRCFAPAGRSICNLELTAETSVALSIGPVCGPKFPGYHEALTEYRASKKHDLYELARAELGIVMSDVELYAAVGGQVSTVKGIERKLDSIPA